MLEIEILLYNQTVLAQPRIHAGKWDTQIYSEISDTNRSPIPGQKSRLSENKGEKRTCRIVNFIVAADLWVKIKESKKRD